MKFILVFLLTGFVSFGLTGAESIKSKENSKIESLLANQVNAWNEGDLEKFMETYLKSDKLVFVGSRGPTYGWQATLDNYRKGYPDKKAMGKLYFKIFEISKIDRKTFFVIGRFELQREIGDLEGHFTLVIQKTGKNYFIISDHSSSSN